MKKLFLLTSVFAAALFTACSSDEPAVSGGNDETGNTETHYLAVNVVSTSGMGASFAQSRADVDPQDPRTGYENGTADENKVTKVRFYFFDENDEAVVVKAGATHNYYDWEEAEDKNFGDGVVDPNVTRQLNAVLVINTKAGDALPAKMLAVVNPREFLDGRSFDLEDIRALTSDYATYANGGTIDFRDNDGIGEYHVSKGNEFPMCNAVYLQDGEIVKANRITTENYQNTPENAEKNPVNIYVEREVAKVRVNTGEMTFEGGLLKLKHKVADNKYDDMTVDGQQIYLKLNGWNVTADLNSGYLSKRINKSWTNETLGFVWNYPAFFRSYWADECTDAVNRYINFKDADNCGFTGDKTFTYCNENAVRTSKTGNQPTKVILSGKLCDEQGNALTICEYYGVKFIEIPDKETGELLPALKAQVLKYLTEDGTKYYKRTEESGKAIYTPISPADITFKTATVAGKLDKNKKGTYYVYPCLTENNTKIKWYTAADGESNITGTALNNILLNMQHAKIWNTGDTYYYADIEHYGKQKGVVRNHIYDIAVGGIYGFGTPVWDDEEIIVPEKPEDDDTYIAAKINILSWRIVPSTVVFDWK
ncbi:MAG: Mfa1 family fimbria major subunit [Muribaculum sp.]|nr:Mfa1 family fimbria major subunit [Muribaculum sp.]